MQDAGCRMHRKRKTSCGDVKGWLWGNPKFEIRNLCMGGRVGISHLYSMSASILRQPFCGALLDYLRAPSHPTRHPSPARPRSHRQPSIISAGRAIVPLIFCGLLLTPLACGNGDGATGLRVDDGPVDRSLPDGVSAGGAVIDPSALLYDAAEFPRFDLEIGPDELAALEKKPRAYVPATFRYRNEVVHRVGVRLKGEYSFQPITGKAAFKFKFDEFVPGQRFRGLRRMTFNNSMEDPSHIAERLSYLVFRNAELPAPRANNATVYVNGEFYGVYVNVETEDEVFLARWFDSNEGNLYEELGQHWLPGNEEDFELETNKTINDRRDLTDLFAAVRDADDATFLEDVAHILDTEAYLRYCALEGIVNQWDGYAYSSYGPSNYRLYHDPSIGRFTLIPWGMDMSMNADFGVANIDLFAPKSPLLKRCLSGPSCTAVYRQVIAEEADRFEALEIAKVAEQAYDQIRGELYLDSRKGHTNDRCDEAFGEVHEFVRQRPVSVRSQL